MFKNVFKKKKGDGRINVTLSLFGKEDIELQLTPVSGKVLAFLYVVVATSYLIHLMVNMTSSHNDVYKSSTLLNDMSLEKIENIEEREFEG